MLQKFTKRQTQIIQESVVLIAEKGIQGLTMKNISTSIGISVPAIYRHFDSKNAILSGIITLMKTSTKEDSTVKKLELSPLQHIELALRNQTEAFVNNPALAAIIFSEEIFISDSKLSQEIRNIMNEKQTIFIELLKNGQDVGEVCKDIDAEQLAIMIIGGFRFIVTQCHLFDCSVDLEMEVDKFINAIKKILIK